ncbi:hypothetical protein PIIN_07960 [Serendipita indica DSM 11827]|uniref:RNA helicase n=1 Tax=Serendipita indica (strain DSM 11827) TaxID=1109443 RepID=G4TRR3_SERID|nr:hypothetical protein PIIN_07960 [Serendipita indica DSM 11827]
MAGLGVAHCLRLQTRSVLLPGLREQYLLAGFHSSALVSGGGPRNPEHKAAARKKKRIQKERRKQQAIIHGSDVRLAKPDQIVPAGVKGKKKQLNSPRNSDAPSRHQNHASKSKLGARGIRNENVERSLQYKDDGFTAGIDDFTMNETSNSSSRSRRTKRNQKQEPAMEMSRESLPHAESSLMANNVTQFSSVPLNTGLVESLADNLGPHVTPTDIQKLSLSHFFKRNPGSSDRSPIVQRDVPQSMTLLASQTGSGKSIAYLLPMLHSIKWRELKSEDEGSSSANRTLWAPKGLILAPTHELARQLSRFAKGLCHNIKLRVLCLSQENKSVKPSSFDDMGLSHLPLEKAAGEFEIHPETLLAARGQANQRPIDVLVGTTSRVLDLSRGRQWRDELEKLMTRNPWEKDDVDATQLQGRMNPPGWKPSLDLSQVDWVVMDEADVVYGADFVHSTELLLNDIQAAKQRLPLSKPGQGPPTAPYPFNLVLCTATIPNSLNQYITNHYSSMERLTSIQLHNLPRSITPEHVPFTGGDRAADVAARLRAVLREDKMQYNPSGEQSKVLIFCNKSSKAENLAKYLTEHDIPAIALVRQVESGQRRKNSDKKIESFMKGTSAQSEGGKSGETKGDAAAPRVLVTTSLLSRGLDFDESVRHVFIVDEPRSMVDFIHRAGRTGRAGERGKVVIFSKSRGRGSQRSQTGLRGEIFDKLGLRPRKVVRRPADAFAW